MKNGDHPLARITALVDEIERFPDMVARERSRELVRAVLEIHRAGLDRALDILAGTPALDTLVRDDAFVLLLAVHGLHPQDVPSRVAAVVDELRPSLRDQGVAIDLVDATDDVARVRLRPAAGSVRGNPAALRQVIETAIGRRAPEIAAVEIDGLEATDVPMTRFGKPRRNDEDGER